MTSYVGTDRWASVSGTRHRGRPGTARTAWPSHSSICCRHSAAQKYLHWCALPPVEASRGPRPKPTPAWITSSIMRVILEAIHAGVGLGWGQDYCYTLVVDGQSLYSCRANPSTILLHHPPAIHASVSTE